MILAVIFVCFTVFMCVALVCSTYRAVRFKQTEDFLTVQREGFGAQRNMVRDVNRMNELFAKMQNALDEDDQ